MCFGTLLRTLQTIYVMVCICRLLQATFGVFLNTQRNHGSVEGHFYGTSSSWLNGSVHNFCNHLYSFPRFIKSQNVICVERIL